jgi:L-amino acid N-acyltransferase YncA
VGCHAGIVVRQADAERDGAAVAAIYAPYVESGAVSFEEVAPDAAEMGRRIEGLSATHPWLVLERGGVVVGYAYGSPHRGRAAYRWTAEVSVYVDRARHRQGSARVLYAALLDLLRQQGFRMAVAGVTLPNDASVRLHEAFGFQPVGVFHRIGHKEGAWHDVGWWELDLAPGTDGPPAEPLPPLRLLC